MAPSRFGRGWRILRRDDDSERWKQVDRILAHAEELGESELRSYLNQTCEGDPGLLRDVEEMLRLAKVDDDLLSRPLLAPPRRIKR